MTEKILMAGSGGQGIILIGKLFASAAMRTIPYVTFFPAYGAEVRGGTSSCEVVLSSEEIASPVSESFDSMIIMSEDAKQRFLSRETSYTTVILNSSMCKLSRDENYTLLPASDLAIKLGDIRIANFIMLGALLSIKELVSQHNIESEIRRLFSERNAAIADINIRALRCGYEYPRHTKHSKIRTKCKNEV